MSSYSVSKLIRSKIQKFINVSLVNLSIDKQIKDKPDRSNVSAQEKIRNIFLGQSKINSIKSEADRELKRFSGNFSKIALSPNHLQYDGDWEKSEELSQDKIKNVTPKELENDSTLKEHYRNRKQRLKEVHENYKEMKKRSDEAKIKISIIKEKTKIPADFEKYFNYKFDISASDKRYDVVYNQDLLKKAVFNTDSNENESLSENIKKSFEKLKNLDAEGIASGNFNFNSEISKSVIEIAKEQNEILIKELKDKIEDAQEEIKKINADPIEFSILEPQDDPDEYLINEYNIDIEIFNVNKDLLKLNSDFYDYTLKNINAQIEVKKIDKEIKKYISESQKKISDLRLKEELKKSLKEIADEELLQKIVSEFKEYGTSIEDVTEYILTEVMQSITTDPFDTIEIYNFLTKKSVMPTLGVDEDSAKIKIITNLIGKDSVSEGSISIPKNQIHQDGTYDTRFGITNNSDTEERYFHINNLIYGKESDKANQGVDLKKGKYSKKNPLMSYIMILDPNLKASKRNELELSVFLNSLSTVELSKSQPYFNAMFILPDAVLKNGKVYKTASITQFLGGTREQAGSGIYRALESKYNKKREDKVYSGTKSNMSLFTAPQTLNNFDEIFVGRQTTAEKEANKKIHKYTRANNVHDITRPFMTIKSFSIDVAPTQGLLSMKTGKVSLVIHDRTRMSEMAPFIKPDMFGAFGAELILEYGWNNIEGQGPTKNYIGEFIDSLKVREKYIITNSSFSLTKNGEVNVDLSIAMRGPIDLKNTALTTDSDTTVNMSRLKVLYDSIVSTKSALSTLEDDKPFLIFRENVTENTFNKTVSGKNLKEFISAIVKNSFGNIEIYVDSLNLKKPVSDFRKECLKIFNGSQKKVNDFKELFNATFKPANGSIYTLVDPFNAEFFSLQDPNVPLPKTFDELAANLLAHYYSYFKTFKETFVNARKVNKIQKDFIDKKIMKALGEEDPFFDRDWSADYNEIKNPVNEIKNQDNPDKNSYFKKLSDKISTSNTDGTSSYVTLGSILTSIVGVHLKETGRYDDIQIISYNVNKSAGLMSERNISSFLISRKDIKEFAEDIFTTRNKITLEGFLSRLIQEHVTSNKQICYGLSDIYENDEKGKASAEDIDRRLAAIDKIMRKEKTGIVEFKMPRIKMYFDTFVKKEAADKSILRITLYDENDNPYSDLSNIFTGENELLQEALLLNRARARDGENSKYFKDKSVKTFEKLIEKGYIKSAKSESGEIIYTIDTKGKIKSKQEIKKLVPSVTYGSQNSGIIDANVTTVNEGNLGTVLMTRNDRKKGTVGNLKVTSDADLPLQILPSKASVTMFGCPIVNFAQYIFLDFETGTTIDNFYAVTGINHSLSPGNFTTSLTLSYGDAYGKYRSALSTIENLVQRTLSGQNKGTYTLSYFEKEKLSDANITPALFNGGKKNYILRTGLKDKILEFDNLSRFKSTEPLTININKYVTLIYKQEILLTGSGEKIISGEHLGSVLVQEVSSVMNDNKINILVNHLIFRTENEASKILIPEYEIEFDDILNLLIGTPEDLNDILKKASDALKSIFSVFTSANTNSQEKKSISPKTSNQESSGVQRLPPML